MARVIPAHGKIAHHTPQVINSHVSPSPSWFTIAIQTPDLFHLIPELFPKDLPESIPVISKPSGKNNEICVERALVFEPQPGLGEPLDSRVVLESDLSVDDHLAGSDVYQNDQHQEGFE